MLEREIRDFVRVALALQRIAGGSIDNAKLAASDVLGCPVPSEVAFNRGLPPPLTRRFRGRPVSNLIGRPQDFAVLVLYFESLGYKQGTREARNYWERHGQNTPAPRHIEKALKEVRQWAIHDLGAWVKSIRSRYRLTKVLETKRLKRRVESI